MSCSRSVGRRLGGHPHTAGSGTELYCLKSGGAALAPPRGQLDRCGGSTFSSKHNRGVRARPGGSERRRRSEAGDRDGVGHLYGGGGASGPDRAAPSGDDAERLRDRPGIRGELQQQRGLQRATWFIHSIGLQCQGHPQKGSTVSMVFITISLSMTMRYAEIIITFVTPAPAVCSDEYIIIRPRCSPEFSIAKQTAE